MYHMYLPHSPSTVMPNGSIRDTGKLVRLILEDGATYFTKTVAFYSEAISEAEKQAMIGKSNYPYPTFYLALHDLLDLRRLFQNMGCRQCTM